MTSRILSPPSIKDRVWQVLESVRDTTEEIGGWTGIIIVWLIAVFIVMPGFWLVFRAQDIVKWAKKWIFRKS